ncbi:DUF1269 domain-containing protein [Novipirellula caenicola]|uniref:DUF1269 domain-containing protein n=1 Tax=Novipirellula caenicola TaxID=1536901 RepID=A0ABP9VMC9_9BACT
MSEKCLIAEFNNSEKFRTAIEVLETADFTTEEVSIVTHASDENLSELRQATETNESGLSAEKTTAASTLAGGTLGAALGTMTMIGPMLVAGPIVGMAAGAVGGSLMSAVSRWGIEHDVAAQYEAKVRDGSVLVIVTGDAIRVNEAAAMLRTVPPTSLEQFDK